MSGYTNAVTNITDESQYYVYPMAASLRGGAVESEYNIRNLMTCLFNKSAAKSDDDFILFYNKDIDGKRPTLETYYNNTSWYNIDLEEGYCRIHDLAVGPGEGNCNGYYTRLYDYTPITSTALNIENLINANNGFTPLLPSDFAPSLPIAGTVYNSMSELLGKETTGTVSEPGEGGIEPDYIVAGQYIDGTSVRVKTDASENSYLYFTKYNNTWILNSDIIAEYSDDGANGQQISGYRIYSDGKYFFINPDNKNNIDRILFKNFTRDEIFTDALNGGLEYVKMPANAQLYKIDTVYQRFNVVLGLNWTVNQLVSSAQITICEDTTPIKYITETDIDGTKTQYAYTEYGILNKNLKDRGLLDAGIVLGTISIKKTPVFNILDNSREYSFEYSCTYEGNRYKTACIDLSRLGTDTDNLGENMYDKISRLFSLMIDNGSLKIGTVIRNSGFDPNPDSVNHDFVKCIAPYRLDLGLTDFEAGTGQEFTTGYLRLVNYNEEVNGATEVPNDLGYILKCRLAVNPTTGECTHLDSVEICNAGIRCFNDIIQFSENVSIGYYDEDLNRDHPCNLYVYGTTESKGLLTANSGLKIAAGQKITFVDGSAQISSTTAGVITTAKLNITNSLTANSIYIPNTTNTVLLADSSRFIVNTAKLDLSSADGSISNTGDITTGGSITATGNITGNKVYGAVWM